MATCPVSSLVGDLLGIKLHLVLQLWDELLDLLVAGTQLLLGDLIDLEDLLDALGLILYS